MGGGKGRKYRKRNLVREEKLTPDCKVSEPEKRIFYLSSISGEYQEILHELPVQESDDENHTLREDLFIPTKDLRVITVEPTADRLKSYSCAGAAAVGLGSQIYSIGGCCFDGDGSLGEDYGCTRVCKGRCHAAVLRVEVNGQPNKEWKQCSSMNRGRKNPLACAVDGKIYVFGGAAEGKFVGEVYDPLRDEWTDLPQLGDFMGYCDVSPINVVLDDPKEASNKLILVHIQGTQPLLAFNVRKNDWQVFDEKFGWESWDGADKKLPSPVHGMWPTNAVVDNFLYCYSIGGLFAYDLDERKWLRIHGVLESDKFRKSIYDSDKTLFHLGGNTLCFIWSYSLSCGEFSGVIIGCAKFKGARRNDKRQSSSSLTLAQQRLGYFGLKDPASDPVWYVLLQADASDVWIQNPREIPGMQSAPYYNMPQAPHGYMPSHTGHASFNAAAAQSFSHAIPRDVPSSSTTGCNGKSTSSRPCIGC